jgi:signal transduction histidine kinase
MAELVQTGHRAQEIEDMMSANRVQDSSKALSGIVEEAVAVLQNEFEADLTVALSGSLQVTANEKILLPMITEALRNAVRHAEDRSPRITVSEQGMGKNDEIILSIEDDGSGIPQREVRVIQSGNEDSLNHGSGLGLWLLQWGATQLGGSVTFAQSESDGTDVRFHLPEDIVSLPESNTVELSEGK